MKSLNSFLICLVFILLFLSNSSELKTQNTAPKPQNDTEYMDALPFKPVVKSEALDKALKQPVNKPPSPYHLLIISISTISLYLITFILSRLKLLTKTLHRRIWNISLLITAIMAVIGGFIITAQLKYNFHMIWYKQLMFWHVEAGIAMTFIAIFHITWHWKYFRKLIKYSLR